MNYTYTTQLYINGELEKESKLTIENIIKLKRYFDKLEKQQQEEENTKEKFEGVFILKTALNGELENIIEELTNKIGNCSKIENLGIKKLAYEIKGHSQGHYIIFNFSATPQQKLEIERYSRINENIIKFIIIERK